MTRLVCPACGAVASYQAWTNEPEIRAVIGTVLRMPHSVGRVVPDYLSLFRPQAGR